MSKKFEMILDLFIKPQTKKEDTNKLIANFEEEFKKVNPNIKIDSAKFKGQVAGMIKEIDKLNLNGEQLNKFFNQMKIGLNTKEANTAINTIKNAMKDVDNLDFKKLDKALSKIKPEDVEKFKAGMGTVKDKVEAYRPQNLAEEFNAKRSQYSQLADTQKTALAQLQVSGKKSTDEYKKLEKQLAETETELRKLNKAGAELENVGQKLTITDKLAKIGLATQGIDNIANSINVIAQPYMELDSATQKIKSLQGEAKALAPEFKSMSLSMAQSLGVSAVEIQTGAYEALSAGIKASREDIEAFMSASTKLAVGGSESVQNTTDVLSSMLNAYGESASKATEYSDVLSATVNYGKTSMSELASSMAQVIPTASAYGFSIKDVGGALALMTANGIPTAQATTKLNQMLVEMQKPGAEMTKVLNNAGVSVASLGEKVKSGKSIEALQDMKMAFDKAGKTATQVFGSVEAGASFNVLTKDFGNLKEMFTDVANSSGMTQSAFEDMGASLENRVSATKANFEALTMGILDSSGAFGEAILVSGKLASEMSPIVSTMASSVTLLSGAGSGIASMAGTLQDKLVPGLKSGAVAQKTLGVAGVQSGVSTKMAWIEVFAIVAAIGATIAGLIWIFDALVETDAERLEKLEGQNKALDKQIELNEKKKSEVETNQSLIKQYEELGSKTNRTTEEQKKFEEITLKIAKAMPGTISSTKSFGENMDSLKGKSTELAKELEAIKEKADKLKELKIDLSVKIAKEKIQQDSKDIVQEFSGMGTDMKGSLEVSKEVSMQFKVVQNAKNEKEVQEAMFKAREAIFSSKRYQSMDAEDQAEIEAKLDSMEKSSLEKIKSFSEKMKIDSEKLGKSISDGTKGGFETKEVQDEIAKIAQETGKSVEEVTDIVQAKIKEGKDAKLGDLLKKQMDIKKGDVSAEGLDELVSKFKNAKTDLEKQNYAEAIKKSAPDAVKFSKQIIDENGKLINVYDVMTDKVKDAGDAEKQRLSNESLGNQDKFLQMLGKEGDQFDFNKGRATELAQEIERKKAVGADTSELEKAYEKLNQENNNSINDLVKNAAQWELSGGKMNGVVEELAKRFGKSPEEVKRLIEGQKTSIQKANEQANAVDGIAGAWGKVKEAQKKEQNELIGTAEALIAKRKRGEKLNEEEQKQWNEIEKKKGVARRNDKIAQEASKEAAAMFTYQAKTQSKQKKELNDLLKEEIDKLEKKNKLLLLEFEKQQSITIMNEKRERNDADEIDLIEEKLKLGNDLIEQTKDYLKQKNLIKEIKEDGTIVLKDENTDKILTAEKKKNEALEKLNKKFNTDKLKESKAYIDGVKKIDAEFEKETKNANSKLLDLQMELDAKIKEQADLTSDLRKKQIEKSGKEWEESLKAQSDTIKNIELQAELTPSIEIDTDSLLAELYALDAMILARKSEIENNKNISDTERKAEMEKLIDTSNENARKILAIKKQRYDKEQAYFDNYSDNYLKELKEKNAKEYYLITKYYDDVIRLTEIFKTALDDTLNKDKAQNLSVIDKRVAKELDALDFEFKKKEVLNWKEQQYEDRKTAILDKAQKQREALEEAHRKKQLSMQAYFAEQSKLLNNAKEAETIKIRAEGMQKQLQAMEIQKSEEGDKFSIENQKKMQELVNSIEEANTQIAEKTDTTALLMGFAGEKLGESIGAMFAGNADKAKDGMRELIGGMLGILGEGLKKQLTATVLQMVFDWLQWDVTSKMLPLPVRLLGIPIATATITGAMNAIANPIISTLTSFSTGGMVDRPTLAMIGDATKTGATNKEWIFTNHQLKQVVAMGAGNSSIILEKRLASIENLLANQTLEVHNHGADILYSVRSAEGAERSRARG